MQRVFVVHYHEIGLKGKNRDFFEQKLIDNIRLSLKLIKGCETKKRYGRILVYLDNDRNIDEVVDKLKKVFGIAYFAPGYLGGKEKDDRKTVEILGQEVWLTIKDRSFESFRVKVKRSDKEFSVASPEVARQIGEVVFEGFDEKKKVDLKNAELTIYIEITERENLIYLDKIKGPGGLPSGTSGRGLCLISSGFDSPVAAYQLAKRGVTVDFIHFHSYPYTNKASQENVEKIVEVINQYQYRGKLYNAAFGEFQKQVVANAPAKLRVVLYRRMMLRVAERLAKKIKAKVLITGDSVGQVASQTIENIVAISDAVTMPILRPLIGRDKEEIIELAEQIGTKDISATPYEDCCSMFVPKNPETKARLSEVQKAESEMDIEKLRDEILEKIK